MKKEMSGGIEKVERNEKSRKETMLKIQIVNKIEVKKQKEKQ